MPKAGGIRRSLNKLQRKLMAAAYDKTKIQEKANQIKKSFQEVYHILNGGNNKK